MTRSTCAEVGGVGAERAERGADTGRRALPELCMTVVELGGRGGCTNLKLAEHFRVAVAEQRSDDVHHGDNERECINEEPAGFVIPLKQLLGGHDPSHALNVRSDGDYAKAHDDYIDRKDQVEDPIHPEEPVYVLRLRQEGNLEWREKGDDDESQNEREIPL